MSKDLSIERALAPHVDPAWAEALLLELRLRGVSGTVIGDVLAEVDAHVVDSGQGAAEAFGEPGAYARELDLPRAPEQSRGAVVRAVLPVLAQVVGMAATIGGAHAVDSGGSLRFTSGVLLSAAAFGAVIAVLVVASEAVMRLLLRSWAVAAALVAVAMVLVVLPMTLPWATAVALPGVPVLVGGIVLLVGATLFAVRDALADDGDPVVSPVPGTARPSRPTWVRAVLGNLRIPVATLVLVEVVLLLG